MSQIIIFSADGCKYCARAKSLLNQHHPTVLDVDAFPQRYQQAAQFTGSSTVPLIFVGNEYIGGSSELEAKMEYVLKKNSSNNDAADEDKSEFHHFLKLPLSIDEQESEKKMLAKKQEKLNQELNFLEQNHISEIRFTFNNNNETSAASNSFSYSEILEYLRYDSSTRIPLQDRGGIIFGKRPQTISGKELFDACKKFLHNKAKLPAANNDNKAKEMIEKLLVCKMIYNAEEYFTFSSDASKSNDANSLISPSTLYRFSADANNVGDFCSHSKHLVNSDRDASTSFVRDNNNNSLTASQAVALSRSLWRCQHLLMTEFRDPKTGLVDYEGELHDKIIENPFRLQHYARFKQLASLLQLVDLSLLSDREKICFGINLYNSLVYMGFAEFYVPWSTMQKISFFGQVGVFIGSVDKNNKPNQKKPLFFGLNDIENGLLRGNRKGLTDIFGTPFSSSESSDPRFTLCVKNVDYRIHFALNCGAKSCPPIKVFSVENLNDELEIAAKAFIQSTSRFDVANTKIVTSQILKWYRGDFDIKLPSGGENREDDEENQEQNVQSVVLKYLPIDLKKILPLSAKTIKKLEDIPVEFSEYDWSFDSKKK